MITSGVQAQIDDTRRDVIGEDWQVQLVVIKTSFDDPHN